MKTPTTVADALRPFYEWADRNRSAVSPEPMDELIRLARIACDQYGAATRAPAQRPSITVDVNSVRNVAFAECAVLITELTLKHGKATGADYEQGVLDHGYRLLHKVRTLAQGVGHCGDYVLVPLEPTQAMVRAAYAEQPGAINAGFAQVYRSMLDAAQGLPSPAQSSWQSIDTAPLDPLRDPPLVMLWVEDGGHKGEGTHAFGRCYRSHDGSVRGVASGFSGNWKIKYWKPLGPGPSVPSTEGE